MLVVDASVLVTALSDDEEDGATVRERLRGQRLVAPEIVDLEVVAIAEAAQAVLLTGDGRSSRAAGVHCEVEILRR